MTPETLSRFAAAWDDCERGDDQAGAVLYAEVFRQVGEILEEGGTVPSLFIPTYRVGAGEIWI